MGCQASIQGQFCPAASLVGKAESCLSFPIPQWVSVCSLRAWQLCQAGGHHFSCFERQPQKLSVTLLSCYYFISCIIYAISEAFLQTQLLGTLSSFKYPVICPVLECRGFSCVYFFSSWTFCSADRLVGFFFLLALTARSEHPRRCSSGRPGAGLC